MKCSPLLLAALLLSGITSVPVNAGTRELENKGAVLFQRHCARCHGVEAVGQDPLLAYGGWRANGTRIAPALNGTAHAWNHSTKLLFNRVKQGSIDRRSSMRPFEKTLSDIEILAVIRYFQSLWPEDIKALYNEKNAGKN